MELISVIVPVYSVEAYLDRCIQSIVEQSYTNLEIILVDDGSPDSCPEICDRWAANDPRIHVIHQANAGAGAARNTGIAIATGSVFAFVDSDDCISPHMYAHLMELLDEHTDIAECELFLTDTLPETFADISQEETTIVCSTEEALRHHIDNRYFCQTPVNKLYRRHTLDGILFPVGNLIDDEFWTYRVLGNAKTLKHSTAKLYAYLQQAGSVMHIAYSLRRQQAAKAKEIRLNYLQNSFPALVPQATANLWLTCLYHGQMSLKHLTKESQEEAFTYLSEVTSRLPNSSSLKRELSSVYRLWFLLSRISFKGACRLRNLLKIGL